MKKRMKEKGYDVGKKDGMKGLKKSRQIGIWKEKKGYK